ncbi:hypothetical protein LEN26_011412 [Aphanomyces euteiches]|nr:hypothetical protein AeMF1_020682 [Aphanomyces euteiches]KAH9119832.1 hypothetical protein LEN26_011412 [Aphanomyces euteiches]KAH9195468.1 hypothetical protein AeNC1_002563 [Aphanomyces euteiches]
MVGHVASSLQGNKAICFKEEEPKLEQTVIQSQEMSLIERKRAQSRASTRRWRANEQHTLDTLRQQVAELEAELKAKLSVNASTEAVDRRMAKLMAKKRLYIAQNMQLQEALKVRGERLRHLATLMQRNTLSTLYDDAFLMYVTRQTQAKFESNDLRTHFQGTPPRLLNGITCMAATFGHSMDYELQKDYHGVNHYAMGDLTWVAYQDKSMYTPLVDRLLDHQNIRSVNEDMVIIATKAWSFAQPNTTHQRFHILQRERGVDRYKVTVTTLNEDLSPAPHACLFEGIVFNQTSFAVRIRGRCCLKTASPEVANATVEAVVFAMCRFETYLGGLLTS